MLKIACCGGTEVTRRRFRGSRFVGAGHFSFDIDFKGGASGGGPRLQIESVSGAELHLRGAWLEVFPSAQTSGDDLGL